MFCGKSTRDASAAKYQAPSERDEEYISLEDRY